MTPPAQPTGPGARAGPPVPWPLGAVAEPFYRAGLAFRNARFDRGRGVVRVAAPVISVGNLSLGGTGKTPAVAWLVRSLVQRGRPVAIAMRGYTRSPDGRSDEADEYQREFPSTPVLVNPDRAGAIRSHLQAHPGAPVPCVVLDDGFQHRRLHRDLDIVLIDATRSPFHDRLFPAGWLREPPGALGRAHAIIITHAEAAPPAALGELRSGLQRLAPAALLAVARHDWAGLVGQDDQPVPMESIVGRAVVAACAIGNPGPFLRQLRHAADVRGELVLPDHDPFAPPTLDRLARLAQAHGAQAIIVTNKDWSKLRHLPPGRWPCPVLRPRLELRFDAGEQALAERALSVAGAAMGPGPAPTLHPA